MGVPAFSHAADARAPSSLGIGLFDRERSASPANRRQAWAGLNKAQAESLLDWLEARRCADREVTWEEGKGFTVSCVPPA